MIVASYQVCCDGPDPDLPDEFCEASFTHTAPKWSDISGLLLQVHDRGWRIERGKTICPLHKEEP